MKRFIEKAEYILLGPLFSESEKLDIATGGYDPDQAIPVPPSETEKIQNGQELKVMTAKQVITRLPILLAQLKAGNNSNTLKNEMRQIAYYLYRSKNLTKTIYNNLMSTI